MKAPLFYRIAAILYTLFIISLAFFAIPAAERLGDAHLLYLRALTAAGVIFTAGILCILWQKRRRLTVWRGLLLILIAAVYALFYYRLEIRIETIHLINFAVLTFFLTKALENPPGRRPVYLNAAALSLAVGGFDELIQKFIPGRFSQWHDVGLCVIGTILGAGLAWIFSPPSEKNGSGVPS